jgi:hypothetical protein
MTLSTRIAQLTGPDRAIDDEFVEGYRDGRDPNSPLPSDNRSEPYRHSFAIGRNEIEGKANPPASVSRERAALCAAALKARGL